MFKRPRLRPAFPLVNASLAAVAIFLSACSENTPEPTENTNENNTPVTLPQNNDAVTLQAVWATSGLENPITSLAFVGGSEPMIAVSLSTGAIQFFDLLGDRITSPVELDVKKLATGQAVVLDDVALTLFPGISKNGDISFYAHAAALGDPLKIDFLPGENARGLCAGPPLDADAIMQLAYWTEETPHRLVHGHVTQDASGELSWAVFDRLESTGGPITTCTAYAELEITTAQTAINIAAIEKYGQRYLITQNQDNDLSIISRRGVARSVEIRDGITIRTPSAPTAIAALSDVTYGNYPDGLLVIGGDVDGEAQITFIDPGSLFKGD